MPTRDGYPEGVPNWVDLATPDVDGAKKFYETLFGWQYIHTDSDIGPYTMVSRNGLAAAGIAPAQEGQPSVWSSYIAVDNVNAIVEKVRAAGGSIILDCTDVPGGRLAFAADPTGAAFGMWETGDFHGASIVNEHGSLNWNELTTDDLDSAIAFYKEVFGYEATTNPTSAGNEYTTFSVAGRGIAGAMAPPAHDLPNYWGIYFAVDDTQAAIRTAVEAGGSKVYGPMEIPDVGIIAGLADPHGAFFTVIELATEVD